MSETPSIPIERPDPRLVQELFDKDPLDLTDQDLDVIIASFRAERMDYLQPKEPKAKKTTAKAAASKAPAIEISKDLLSDLGLDL